MMKGSSALLSRFFKQQGSALSRDITSSRVSSSHRVLSTSALPNSDHHESEKMLSEGGGSATSFHEKKAEVKGVSDANQPSKNEWQETKDSVADVGGRAKNKLNEATDKVSENVSGAADTAKDKLHQAKDSVSEGKDEASDVAGEKAGQAKSVMGKLGEQAKKEMNTSADMMKGMKDVPQKVSETTQGLKEVGVEAAKAVKRDAGRVAEKVGLKTPS